MSEDKIVSKSIAQFIVDNPSLTGFETPKSGGYQLIREIVENSTDSTEIIQILPDIELSIKKLNGYFKVKVKDNGIGLSDIDIPKAFGSVLTSSKYINKQQRGIFGMGIKSVLLYAYITTNKPFIITSSKFSSFGKIHKISIYEMVIDTVTNQPRVVSHEVKENKRRWHGFELEFQIGYVDFDSVMKEIREYLAITHAICPYANITFRYNDQAYLYQRKVNKAPIAPMATKFHPYGVEFDYFKTIAIAEPTFGVVQFLTRNFQRVGHTIADQFCKFAKIDPVRQMKTFSHDELFNLKLKMNEFDGWQPPNASGLSIIGEEYFMEGTKELHDVDFFTYKAGKGVFSGSAFVVEVCCVIPKDKPKSEGKNGDNVEIHRIVNKIPLIEDYKSCLLRKIFDDYNWNYYKIDTNSMKLVFYVHFCSSSRQKIFKDLRKGTVADTPEIRKVLDLTIKDALRKVSSFSMNKERRDSDQKRVSRFEYYTKVMSKSLSYLSNKPKEEVEEKLRKCLIHENV